MPGSLPPPAPDRKDGDADRTALTSTVTYGDAPGSVTGDLRSLPYRHIRRPKWPL